MVGRRLFTNSCKTRQWVTDKSNLAKPSLPRYIAILCSQHWQHSQLFISFLRGGKHEDVSPLSPQAFNLGTTFWQEIWLHASYVVMPLTPDLNHVMEFYIGYFLEDWLCNFILFLLSCSTLWEIITHQTRAIKDLQGLWPLGQHKKAFGPANS